MFSPQTGPRHAGRSASQFYHRIGIESQLAGSNDAHRLVAMLFDGFFEALAQAHGALLAGQTEAKGRAIGHAMRIVDEGLKASLDHAAGGEIAANLGRIYGYVTVLLTEANNEGSDEKLAEAARLLEMIREGWRGIADHPAARG